MIAALYGAGNLAGSLESVDLSMLEVCFLTHPRLQIEPFVSVVRVEFSWLETCLGCVFEMRLGGKLLLFVTGIFNVLGFAMAVAGVGENANVALL